MTEATQGMDEGTDEAMVQPSPTPWYRKDDCVVDYKGRKVALVWGSPELSEIIADHIVKCVNGYDRLEAELSNVKRLLGYLVQGMDWWAAQEDGLPGELAMEYTQARGALNWEYYTTQQTEALARAEMNMNMTDRLRKTNAALVEVAEFIRDNHAGELSCSACWNDLCRVIASAKGETK